MILACQLLFGCPSPSLSEPTSGKPAFALDDTGSRKLYMLLACPEMQFASTAHRRLALPGRVRLHSPAQDVPQIRIRRNGRCPQQEALEPAVKPAPRVHYLVLALR